MSSTGMKSTGYCEMINTYKQNGVPNENQNEDNNATTVHNVSKKILSISIIFCMLMPI